MFDGSRRGAVYLLFGERFNEPEPPCPGNVDGDQDVDLDDLTILLQNFGDSGVDVSGDLDGNGTVDLDDLTVLLQNFGQPCP
jgi:hypothetical protein